MSAGTPGGSRPIELARGAWGLLVLAAPGQVVSVVSGSPADHRAVVVARILGARHLAQALLSGIGPGPQVLAAGAWVDTVHAATAVAFAALDRSRARSALVDAAVAGSWAALGVRDAHRTPPPAHAGWHERAAGLLLPLLPFAPRP